MSALINDVVERVSALPDSEKLALVDEILKQLDRPDPEIDQIWAEEARKRWLAYSQGRLKTFSYAEVMERFRGI
jgi:putative addiction module component (TIGR02574 family)